MDDTPENSRQQMQIRNLGIAGILFGATAAIFYSLANAFLRELSKEVDPVLVAAAKATCTAVVVWPIALYLWSRGKDLLPPLQGLLWMLFAAIQVQLLGGVMLQVSLGILGIALTIPIYMGAMIVGTAVMGRVFLNEPLNKMLATALAVLVLSVFVLCLGADAASAAIKPSSVVGGVGYIKGVLAGISTGLSYAILGIVIRGVFRKHKVPEHSPIIIVATVGMLMLGAWSLLFRDGIANLQDAGSSRIAMMIAAGVANALGFLCLARSLKLLPAVFVNSINVSQVAIGLLIGILIFAEPLSPSLLTGLVLMVIGFVLLSNGRCRQPNRPQ